MVFHAASPCDSKPGQVTPALLQCPTRTSTQHVLERSAEEGNPGQGDWEWGGQSQHGLHFNCQASLWMEHLYLGLPSHSKVTLPHISSPLLKSFSHSLLLPTLLKRLFCTFRLDLHTKTEIPAPLWSSQIVPTRSFPLQTLTSVLPDQHCQQESSTNTAIDHRAH